ncbi:MAG: hypothetical protein SP1CHLAM54_16220 [Chlamydiia bacterium]|nr:hypothetical protein [Chlamydiia bacterium]MCH9616511.1 hypothetical protein [Chlamydiia bacterium]MCH9629503.1 hypothetical protein [Chlamydiia bacterium]
MTSIASQTRTPVKSFRPSCGQKLIRGLTNPKHIGTALVVAGLALMLFGMAVGLKGVIAPNTHIFSHFNPKAAMWCGIIFGAVALGVGRYMEDKFAH